MSSTLLTEKSLQQWLTDFEPRRFLSNAHLQTLAGNFLRRDITLPLPERMLVEVEGPVAGYGSTSVACDCHWQPEEVRSQRLTVILVHGLEGSSKSRYVLGNTARALAAGMNVVRMNMRSCGGADEISPTIYHSGRSEDVAAVVRAIIARHRLEAVALVGYSMGGNLVLKYLGEIAGGIVPQVKAAVGISPLMDLAVSSAALHEKKNRIYEWHFLRSMKGRLHRKAVLYPRLYADAAIDTLKTMRDFDQHIVARYGGFADADDYYYSVASSQYAARFDVPTLIVHSKDDPFIRMLPQTRDALAQNPLVTLIETQKGGHCAFLASSASDDGRWAESTLLGYLQEHSVGS